MNNPTVSVIIPVYNGENIIGRTLEAVMSQRNVAAAEIIVVDDGSTDGTAEIVRFRPDVTLIRQDNAGPAAARHAGAQRASGRILAFTDADCIPHPDWLEKLLQPFVNDRVGAVAGSYGLANPASRLARCIQNEIRYRHDTLMPDEIRVFGSYNVAIRKEVYDRAGGFDPVYRRASGEDNDLSYKLLGADYTIAFARDALVDHFHTESLGKYLAEQGRHGYWRARMYADHPHMSCGDDYTFWKDMVEVPLAAGVMLLLAMSFFFNNHVVAVAMIFLGLLYVLEFYFCTKFHKRISEILFGSLVMLLRSFFRTAGFTSGILSIILSTFNKKKTKKV